jgi:hypothetical protein
MEKIVVPSKFLRKRNVGKKLRNANNIGRFLCSATSQSNSSHRQIKKEIGFTANSANFASV